MKSKISMKRKIQEIKIECSMAFLKRFQEGHEFSADGKELPRFPQLENISLSYCEGFDALLFLNELAPQLKTLVIQSCYNLTNVDGLQGLSQLSTLDLFDCTRMTCLMGLTGLKLKNLYTDMCDNLVF